MYGEVFAGTTVRNAGQESLSIVARKVSAQLRKGMGYSLNETGSMIEILETGDVREVLKFGEGGVQLEVHLMNGRLTDLFSRSSQDTDWYQHQFPYHGLNIFMSVVRPTEVETQAEIDAQEIEYRRHLEIEEERGFIQEMIDDSRRYPLIPVAMYQRHAELGI